MHSEVLYYILVFVFGACIGSFLNVVIWRLPRGEKLNGRSHCAHCNHELNAWDLFPVFSYIFLRGRCRYCMKKISPRYWLIELITAGLFVLASWLFTPETAVGYIVLAKIFFVLAVCIVVFVIDLEHYLILDKVVFPAIAILLIYNLARDIFIDPAEVWWAAYTFDALIGAVAGGIPFFLLWYLSKGRWMGFGDVKFVIFMGLALGSLVIGVALFVSFILGSIVGIPLVITGKKEMSSKIPFGTFLAIGTVIALFWGGSLLHWYLGLIAF